MWMPLFWVLAQIGQHCTTILWVEVKITSSSYCILVELSLNMMQQCQRMSVQVYSELSVAAALQLVSSNWPVLDTDSHLHARE